MTDRPASSDYYCTITPSLGNSGHVHFRVTEWHSPTADRTCDPRAVQVKDCSDEVQAVKMVEHMRKTRAYLLTMQQKYEGYIL